LKGFRDDYYKSKRNCKAHLQPVLDFIEYMKELNLWLKTT